MTTRRILTARDVPGRLVGSAPDSYTTSLFKSIPADVVAAWVFLDGILAADPLAPHALHWTVFAAVLLLTPLWTWYTAYEPGLPMPTLQVLSSTAAFGVWAFALGGPFEAFGWYTPTLASVLLALYTLTAPILPFLAARWHTRSRRR